MAFWVCLLTAAGISPALQIPGSVPEDDEKFRHLTTSVIPDSQNSLEPPLPRWFPYNKPCILSIQTSVCIPPQERMEREVSSFDHLRHLTEGNACGAQLLCSSSPNPPPSSPTRSGISLALQIPGSSPRMTRSSVI